MELVEVVVASSIAESIPAGSEAVFNAGSTVNTSVSFNPNTSGRFVIAYWDAGQNNYGKAIVGTVSGTSISFGTEVTFNSGNTTFVAIAFDPDSADKFVIMYSNGAGANTGKAIVGTVSGTSMSFGTAVTFNSAETTFVSIAIDSQNKYVLCYRDYGVSQYGRAVVGTVSGTSISFGSAVSFTSSTVSYTSVTCDPNTANKFVVCYRELGSSNGNHGVAIVGTISGTSISFGTAATFNASASGHIFAGFDPNTAGKFVVAYSDGGNSSYGTSSVGTVSGTSISYGSKVIFNSGVTNWVALALDPNTANKFVVTYSDNGNSNYGAAIVGSISGTSTSFGSEYVYNAGYTVQQAVAFNPHLSGAGNFLISFRDSANSSYGTAILGQLAATVTATNLTSTNFIGITDEAISSGATGKATIKGGIKTGLSSLTPNAVYYVQADGTISTTSTSPAVRIGKALSSTSINLEYNS